MLLTERIKTLAEPLHMTFASIEREVGIGRGTIRKWDVNCPAADKLLKVANLLNTTMDYLMTGQTNTSTISISLSEDMEWLNLIHRLPEKKQIEFKAKMEGYLECYEESVAADEPYKKTGTTNSAK
ncbi:MAG: helix-turn-helix domain-containing protein [Lactobacillus sp.]|nr:helix-turn-helix domain-containing protein [Lactobacillus sp.]